MGNCPRQRKPRAEPTPEAAGGGRGAPAPKSPSTPAALPAPAAFPGSIDFGARRAERLAAAWGARCAVSEPGGGGGGKGLAGGFAAGGFGTPSAPGSAPEPGGSPERGGGGGGGGPGEPLGTCGSGGRSDDPPASASKCESDNEGNPRVRNSLGSGPPTAPPRATGARLSRPFHYEARKRQTVNVLSAIRSPVRQAFQPDPPPISPRPPFVLFVPFVVPLAPRLSKKGENSPRLG